MRAYRIIFPVMMATMLTAAAPAAAEDAAVPVQRTATETDAVSGGKDKQLICKRIENTESRMRSLKACHTREEWKRIEKGDY